MTVLLSKDLIKNNDRGLVLKKNFNKNDIIDKLTTLIEDKNLRIKLG